MGVREREKPGFWLEHLEEELLPSTERGRFARGWGGAQFWMLVFSSKMPLLENLQFAFICLFVLHWFLHSFIYSFFSLISALICSFIHSLVHLSVHLLIHSLVGTSAHSFTHLFICAFIHSLI